MLKFPLITLSSFHLSKALRQKKNQSLADSFRQTIILGLKEGLVWKNFSLLVIISRLGQSCMPFIFLNLYLFPNHENRQKILRIKKVQINIIFKIKLE
jgi:hypothetical protein